MKPSWYHYKSQISNMELQYLVFIWYFNFVLIQFFFCYAFPLERVYLYCSIMYLKCATSILILQGFKIRSAWLLKKIWNVDSWRMMVLFKLWTLKDRLCEFCIVKYIWKFRHQKYLNCMMLKLCVCVSSGKEWRKPSWFIIFFNCVWFRMTKERNILTYLQCPFQIGLNELQSGLWV